MNRYSGVSYPLRGYSDASKSRCDFSEDTCLTVLTNRYTVFDPDSDDPELAGFIGDGNSEISRVFLIQNGWLDLLYLMYYHKTGIQGIRELRYSKDIYWVSTEKGNQKTEEIGKLVRVSQCMRRIGRN
jgi:hypothetical protein